MKNKPGPGGSTHDGGGDGEKRDQQRLKGEYTKNEKKRRNMQRLGGKGLSLQAFANAKSRTNDYNPALISMFVVFSIYIILL